MAAVHRRLKAKHGAPEGPCRHTRALAAALAMLASVSPGLAQVGWAAYDVPASHQTLYVQPASSDPVTNRRVAWIANPVSIGDRVLRWAYETAAGPEHAELHCQLWDFDGVRDGSLVFTVIRLDTSLDASDPADRSALTELAAASHGSRAWAQLLVTSACTRFARDSSVTSRHDPRVRTLYVPLDRAGSGTAVLTRPWSDGFLGLRFDFATNTLSIRQL